VYPKPQMLHKPSARDGIGLEVRERVQQQVMPAPLVRPPERVSANRLVRIEQPQEFAGCVTA